MTTSKHRSQGTTFILNGCTVLVHDAEKGETGYWAQAVELPGCCTQGETLDELRVNVQDAIACMLEFAGALPIGKSAAEWP